MRFPVFVLALLLNVIGIAPSNAQQRPSPPRATAPTLTPQQQQALLRAQMDAAQRGQAEAQAQQQQAQLPPSPEYVMFDRFVREVNAKRPDTQKLFQGIETRIPKFDTVYIPGDHVYAPFNGWLLLDTVRDFLVGKGNTSGVKATMHYSPDINSYFVQAAALKGDSSIFFRVMPSPGGEKLTACSTQKGGAWFCLSRQLFQVKAGAVSGSMITLYNPAGEKVMMRVSALKDLLVGTYDYKRDQETSVRNRRYSFLQVDIDPVQSVQ